MNRVAGWMSVLMLMAAPPALADNAKCPAADAQACLDRMTAMRGKAWAGLVYERADGGMRVKTVDPGGPAEKAGIQVGDLMLTMNGASFSDKEGMRIVI